MSARPTVDFQDICSRHETGEERYELTTIPLTGYDSPALKLKEYELEK